MKGMASSRELRVVTDARAVAVLLDPEFVSTLKPFMAGPCTIRHAAEMLDMRLERLYYRAQRMLELGLLEIVREEPRRGRPMKVYQSSAEAFFIPFHSTPFERVEDLIIRNEESWSRRLVKSVAKALTADVDLDRWGLNIAFRDGYLMFGYIMHPPQESTGPQANADDADGVSSEWTTDYYLSASDVEQMVTEVYEVLNRYRERRTGPRRVLRFAVAPWEV